ncbi:MAG: extracellular solute-binding protein [Oscillochloris sp.]|nr:extracellular solute-binding protein [Oscillochloris sp.]
MMLRKQAAWLLMLALIVPLIAACGGATQTTPAEDPAAPAGEASTAGEATAGETTTCYNGLEVEPGATLTFQAAGNPTEQQLYIEGAQRFEEACPGVSITFEPMNDYQTQMRAAFSAGTAPDVFLLDGELMGAFAPNGLLLPLDDAMQQAGVNPGDYFDPTFELYRQDGQTYGLPKDFNPLVVFVNGDLAEAPGSIRLPSRPGMI